jgi:hypothetical protein
MPITASSLLLAAFAAATVEAAAGADGEVAVGRAPVDFTGNSRDTIAFTLTPGAGVRVHSADNNFVLSYTPRIFFREPNVLGLDHPLVLHQVGLDHLANAGKDVTWASTANLAVGEIDYTASGIVADPAFSNVLRASITDILRATVQTGPRIRLSPHLRLNWDVAAEYTVTLNDNGPQATAADQEAALLSGEVPASFQLRTHPSLSYSIDRPNSVAFGTDVTYQWFKQTARYLLVSPDITWQTQLSRDTQLQLSAGIAYVWTLQVVVPNLSDKNSLGGTGSVALSSQLLRGGHTRVKSAFNAGLDWYFDPILGTSTPRATAKATTDVEIGRRWLIAPLASFTTVLRRVSIRLPAGVSADAQTQADEQAYLNDIIAAPDQTILRIELPIRYQISPISQLMFGLRSAFRGRALPQPGFRLDEQTEFWAFVGLAIRMGTTEDRGMWLPL